MLFVQFVTALDFREENKTCLDVFHWWAMKLKCGASQALTPYPCRGLVAFGHPSWVLPRGSGYPTLEYQTFGYQTIGMENVIDMTSIFPCTLRVLE